MGDHGQPAGIRFIPAGAGNSWSSPAAWPSTSVHPRGRGEQAVADDLQLEAVRFIPAGAGNSMSHPAGVLTPAVHPRGRGEQMSKVFHVLQVRGSSPRARGTVTSFDPERIGNRFIPAGAGNRISHWVGRFRFSVHPRGRGEQPVPLSSTSIPAGSSPRARGTVFGAAFLLPLMRFIPAGAGNSTTGLSSGQMVAVHPRGRGEQSADTDAASAATGSSPRARGTACR